MENKWHVLSLNEDLLGLEFVSTAEMRDYPIFATMFHPEKNAYEWKKDQNNPHSFNAVYSARYFYDFFVNESRRNFHNFSDELKHQILIENFKPVYSGKFPEQGYDTIYLFN